MNVETLFRVAALNTEYANCIDADRLEEWPGLFLEQCLYKITTADNHRRDCGRTARRWGVCIELLSLLPRAS